MKLKIFGLRELTNLESLLCQFLDGSFEYGNQFYLTAAGRALMAPAI